MTILAPRPRFLALLACLAALGATPLVRLAAQVAASTRDSTPESTRAHGARRPTRPMHARATRRVDLDEPDEPGSMELLNRQLWDAGRKRISYDSALRYVAAAQARGASARSGDVTLPNGWLLAPEGRQTAVGRLPYAAVPFAGRLVVLNSGWYGSARRGPQQLSVVDTAGGVDTAITLPSLFPSAWADGDSVLYVSGGYEQVVYRLDARIRPDGAHPPIALGRYVGGIAPAGPGRIVVTALGSGNQPGPSDSGSVLLVGTRRGDVQRSQRIGFFPTGVFAVGGRFYVLLTGENAVAVLDSALAPHARLVVGRAPQAACVAGRSLYVVNSGSDTVDVVDTRSDRVVRRIPVAFRGARVGSAPSGCAVAGGTLYVTLADANALAVLDTTGRLRGYVPTAFYPSSVVASGSRIWVVAAKGIRARRPNDAGGPSPENSEPGYVLSQLQGSVAAIDTAEITRSLGAWTRRVEHGSPLYSPARGPDLPIRHVFYVVRENRTYDQVLGDLGRGNGDSLVTLFGRDVTPAAHQLALDFVTLDDFFADGEISVLGHSFTTSGYASPFLEWLGNTAYSGRFRSYPFGTVPAVFSPAYLWDALDARRVSYRVYGEPYYLFTAAYRLLVERYGVVSPLTQRFYRRALALADSTDRGGRFQTAMLPWDSLARTEAGALRALGDSAFAYRLSRYFTGDLSLAHALAGDPTLRRRFAAFLSRYSLAYRPWDLRTSDLDRLAVWERDFAAHVCAGDVPAFNYLWLPNDHTGGTAKDVLPPDALVAQNDAALGRLVEIISHSPVWDSSVILVEEDDAQNGPDHVDATRTVALAAGPYVRRGAVVTDRYDQLSVLRTAELLLGLDPLSLNDALAVPMLGALTTTPDRAPFVPPAPSARLDAADALRLGSLPTAPAACTAAGRR